MDSVYSSVFGVSPNAILGVKESRLGINERKPPQEGCFPCLAITTCGFRQRVRIVNTRDTKLKLLAEVLSKLSKRLKEAQNYED